MGSEANSILKLPLFSPSPKLSPKEPSGISSPPLRTSAASIPFLWEEEPGKPRPCTALIPLPLIPPLDLPPRLITKTPSPTTVLDGPYVGKSVISSSFRIFRSSSKRVDSFDSRFSGRFSPERVQIGTLFLGENKGRKGMFGNSWGQMQKTLKLRGGKQEFGGEGGFVFSPSLVNDSYDDNETETTTTVKKVKGSKIKRNGSFSNLSHAKSHLWTSMFEGIKQAIPWKSRKSKKQVHIV